MAASGGHWSKGNFKPAAGTIAKAKGAAAAKNMAAAAPKASETPKPLKFTGSATKNYYNTGVVYKGKSTFEGTIQKMNFSDPKAKWAVSMDINGRKKTAMDYFSSLKAAKAEVDAAYKNWLKG